MTLPTVYLAGAIRDGVDEDVEWREAMIAALLDAPGGPVARVWNPLAGKTFNTKTREWDMDGVRPVASVIVNHDFWYVDNADVCVFNFSALSEGHPCIGTLVEFGRATKSRCLIYSVVDPAYTGTGNGVLFKDTLHPFIAHNSAIVFHTVGDCVLFMARHLRAFSGASPRFRGYILGGEER